MKLTVCRIKPKGPIHLGERENWREGSGLYIHSDTLFSAFCHCYQLLYSTDELEKLLKPFVDGNPPFLISSTFLYWKETYFFPIPKNQFPETKEAKKIKFIERIGFEKLLNGEKIENVISNSRCIPDFVEKITPWSLDNVPRVSLNRYSNHPLEEGGFFHFGEVFYHEDAELYFLIKYKDTNYRQRIESAFRLMCDEGIGGDRSSGKGLFYQPTFDEIEIDIPVQHNGIIALSLFFPANDELQDMKNGFYELIERKGYIYSPYGTSLRRKSIRMFTEGSVFPAMPVKHGKIISVKPAVFSHHEVYRYGFIFSLPCKMEINDESKN
ncbi:MAG: type III-A CRISPR-associated RAMP protein Csm4 [bacterium]